MGGSGGTGSRDAHTGVQISSHGNNTSLCRRFAICVDAATRARVAPRTIFRRDGAARDRTTGRT